MAGLLEEGEGRVRIDDYLDGNCNYHTNTLFFIGILLKYFKISLVNLQPANYRTR